MNVTLEKTSDVAGKFVVNVQEDDYASKVKNELKKIAKEARIPGFRPGHVPAQQVSRIFGKKAKSDVLNETVYMAVIDYIRDNKLNVLGEPLPVNVKEINLDDKDYTFEYEIGLAPELDIVVDKNVTLPFYKIEVSDQMYDERDKAMRERLGAQVPGEEVQGKALVKGVLQQLNADGTVNENEGAIQVINGIVAPFLMKDQDEAAKFMGKHVNDKIVFNPWKSCEGNAAELSSMLNIDKEIAVDVKNDFEMAVAEIIVLKPAEHDQEFYDNVFGKDNVKTEEEYKAKVVEMIGQELNGSSTQYFEAEFEQYFMDKYGNMELPVEFLKKWLVARNEELTEENIDAEFEKMLPSLKWELIQERLSKKLDVKVTEEALNNFAQQAAYHQFAQYGITNMDQKTIEESAKRLLADDKTRERLANQLNNILLTGAVRNAVTIDEKTVSLDQFKEFVQKMNESRA